ncbi:Cyclin-T1-3 [Dichanthelium oligosanthes]|uniref:Cyclin-T1-3 n=1 Tax=Dichanthelium oligosanthes TaxID=888268 RepID=A0A1E5UYN7_9POAL|nr:Cyclin-T1-3 [Dichanthelium oligosanthes]
MDVMQTSDSSHHGIVEDSPYRIPYGRNAEGGKLGNSWYFSRKEIEENSLSRRDGIDVKKESYLRKTYCIFLQDLGMRLQVPQVTIATAIVFCHRFFLRQSHAKNDRRTIATVCMFLAGKVEETPRPLRDVILLSYEIIHKKDPAAVQRIKQKEVYEQQKELILIGERVVLVTLGFDLNIHHPYKPLVEAIKKFKVAQNALAQVAWNFVNDGLRTSLCLQFKPHHIAAGAIFLAAKFLKVKLPSDGEKVWWQEFDVTPRHLEGGMLTQGIYDISFSEISNQILELYEQSNVAPPSSQGNDTDRSPASVNHRALGKAPGTVDALTAHEHHQASRQSSQQNVPGHRDYEHPHPEKQNSNQRTPQNEARDGATNSTDGPKMSSSMMDAMKKIDKDKVKAALEKRRKSKGDVSRKVDVMDDDDLIERELEHGVELAAEGEKVKQERRQSWPHPAHREDQQKAARMTENTEEGELSTDSQEHHSPAYDNRRRNDVHDHWNYDRGERDIKRSRP